jgi:hypothetical protein
MAFQSDNQRRAAFAKKKILAQQTRKVALLLARGSLFRSDIVLQVVPVALKELEGPEWDRVVDVAKCVLTSTPRQDIRRNSLHFTHRLRLVLEEQGHIPPERSADLAQRITEAARKVDLYQTWEAANRPRIGDAEGTGFFTAMEHIHQKIRDSKSETRLDDLFLKPEASSSDSFARNYARGIRKANAGFQRAFREVA